GVMLGGSSYVRNRKHEFTGRNIPRVEILATIDEAISEVPNVIRELEDETMESEYPLELAGVRFNKGDFLLHLLSHLAYHLGQIDYHRRIVTGENKTAGSISIPKLISAKKQ
ncbi:MAG: DinB family protein, partial [Calditrichota bacterium]